MMNQIATQETRPWDLPIWKPDRTKRTIFIYLVAIHLLAVLGLMLYPAPDLRVLAVALGVTGLGGFGTTVCYHRLLAHRTFRLNKAVEHILIFSAILNGSGAPATWVAYHRQHHSHADTPKDISSPRYGGFWWAHIRWLYQSPPSDVQRWCPELKGGWYKFWEHAENSIIFVSLFLGVALGWEGFYWIGPIRLVYSLHMQCLVNSLTHLSRGDDADASRNIWWLGPLQLTAWGENWHRNHHARPGSARLGLQWWQVDIGWYFICLLETVGVATHVKRPGATRR